MLLVCGFHFNHGIGAAYFIVAHIILLQAYRMDITITLAWV